MSTPSWRGLADRLVGELVAAGVLHSTRWRAAFREVPRHRLVPVYYRPSDGIWREARTDTPEGLGLAYSNVALFTMPGGLSSSSMPGLMARMLEALDLRDGHDVLEIGTGTGYNAALLCHGIGDQHVSSVDIEPMLVELARERLSGLGYHPVLASGDGSSGLPDRAPFDRLIATCAVPRVPFAWVEQTAADGVLLVDLKIAESAGNLVLLRRVPGGAQGRFLRDWGGFMWLRTGSAATRHRVPRDPSAARGRTTSLTLPRPWEHLRFWFYLQLVDGPLAEHGQVRDDTTGLPGDGFLAATDGSWCEIGQHAGAEGTRVIREGGPRSLSAAVEDAYRRWTSLGEPAWERFGLTVTRDQHIVWLDDPDGPNQWPLPAA